MLRFLRSCGEPPYCPEICFLTSAATVLERDRDRVISERDMGMDQIHLPVLLE